MNTIAIITVLESNNQSFFQQADCNSIIETTYNSIKNNIENVYVATDRKKVFDAVIAFGGNVIMSSEPHSNSTSCCMEVVDILQNKGNSVSHVINVQDYKKFVPSTQIIELQQLFENPSNEYEVFTLIKPVTEAKTLESESEIFVTFTRDMYALYFSRSVIPFNTKQKFEQGLFYQQVGVYGYSVKTLERFCSFNETTLEKKENLEQLRWLENGGKVKLGLTTCENQIPFFATETKSKVS